MAATDETRSRIVCRLSGRKTSVEIRFVKMRVLDGGVGCTSGGRLERSRVRDDRDFLEEAVEDREGGSGLVRSRS